MRKRESKTDFVESSLPNNRFELFFDIMKNQYRTLILIGFLVALFSIPLIVVLLFKDTMKLSFVEQLAKNEITNEECLSLVLVNDLTFDAINILGFAILGLGMAGIIKIIKRVCFLDPVFIKEDFKEGIKDNAKQMCGLFMLFGLVVLICDFSLNYSTNKIVGFIPTCIAFSIIIPTFLIMMCSLSIYQVKFFSCLSTSFFMYIKSALKTLLVYLICLLPVATIFIENVMIKYLVFIFVLLILSPIILVLLFDYFCGVFDEQVNKDQYPEIYRKGLYKK